jgi:NADH-quinone oxidoreductase subunit K
MNETALLQNYLLVGALLFGIGLIGFVVRRNIIIMFLCAEMMLQGVSVSFVAWGRYHGNWDGQSLVLFIIAVAACEAGIALALIVVLCQRGGSLDITVWQQLREEGQPAYVDREIPDERVAAPEWPELTPAGIEPEIDIEEQMHRSHV